MKTLLLLIVVAASAPQLAAQQYAGRKIDLNTYINPNEIFRYVSVPGDSSLYVRLRENGRISWKAFTPADLKGDVDLKRARSMLNDDLAKRIIVMPRVDPVNHRIFVRADTANDEHFNLYEVVDGDLRQITQTNDVNAVFPYGGRVLLVARAGEVEPFIACLSLVNQNTLVRKTFFCTDQQDRAIGAVRFQDDTTLAVGRRLFRIVGDSAVLTGSVQQQNNSNSPTWKVVAKQDPARATQWYLGDKLLPSSTAPENCNVDTVQYDSFDRKIKALLFTPKHPLPDIRDRLAVVHAYYGFDSDYSPVFSLWCEAGITTLSPDIDRETRGDRGGDEIVDGIYAAKWLQQRTGLESRQIGAWGQSQGGYNVMRLLTFQPETNGRNVAFDFGFGISESGYSSMVTQFQHTNTESPDIIATGDPRTEAGLARLRERSPVDQVARLKAPLLLIHGTNDYRVQIAESEQMYAAGKALHKDVTLVRMPGEGHGVASEANLRTYYATHLAFLERVRKGAHTGF